MKYGVREICDVVLKAKYNMRVGDKIFYKNEPVIYFDSLKTSSMEGATTTVYAQGGRGNARLIAWEGERTVTWTMEDALISPQGFMILSGAGLIQASEDKPIYQHVIETTDEVVVVTADNVEDYSSRLSGSATIEEGDVIITINNKPYLPTDKSDNFAYVMLTSDDNEPITEPFIPLHYKEWDSQEADENGNYILVIKHTEIPNYWNESEVWDEKESHHSYTATDVKSFHDSVSVLCDYYTPKTSGARQIDITPDKFGGNYYLEASTLWRDTNGADVPAEFIIPNCKIQSNFTFTMASSGDPSTFTFTMDAFPDYTRFNKSKKVLAAIQLIETGATDNSVHRHETSHEQAHDFLDFGDRDFEKKT